MANSVDKYFILVTSLGIAVSFYDLYYYRWLEQWKKLKAAKLLLCREGYSLVPRSDTKNNNFIVNENCYVELPKIIIAENL